MSVVGRSGHTNRGHIDSDRPVAPFSQLAQVRFWRGRT
jgi:hypothetical protein